MLSLTKHLQSAKFQQMKTENKVAPYGQILQFCHTLAVTQTLCYRPSFFFFLRSALPKPPIWLHHIYALSNSYSDQLQRLLLNNAEHIYTNVSLMWTQSSRPA